jgi:MPBQ/MSBQ methyltransferase
MTNPSPPASPSTPLSLSQSYNGGHIVFRLLRCSGWGPELMSFGYFPRRGFLALPANMLVLLSRRQFRLASEAIEQLEVQAGDEVIDIACGRGGASYIMKCSTPAARVTGVDLLAENIRLAKDLFPRLDGLDFVEGDAQALPLADRSVSRALCCEAAFHFPDKARFIREAARVLKPGGRLVVVDFVWTSAACREYREQEFARHIRDIWHMDDLFTAEEYRSAGEAAGLQLSREIDWTDHVTRPLQEIFEANVWLARRAWGRRVLRDFQPLTRHFSDADWDAVAYSARAHRFMVGLTSYKVFVFDKAI